MSLRKFALGLSAGLIGITALVGGTGVAHADPENDATPEIIEDLIAVIPPLTQDARVLTPAMKTISDCATGLVAECTVRTEMPTARRWGSEGAQ